MLTNFRVLGTRVDAVQIPEAIAQLRDWIDSAEGSRYVAVMGMHGVAESRQDPYFRKVLNAADLVVPDGMPLVWLARLHRHPLRRRVYGPELMEAFCRETGPAYRHFFYGGATGVAERLASTLSERYGVTVAGTYSPPFRPLRAEEEKNVARAVQESHPDLLWVGLGTPRQERWMYEHRDILKVPVMLGVGAAFDLNSGGLRQAPPWMREHGLEWLFRLLVEPRRLWKRYLITIPKVAGLASLELLGLIRVSIEPRH